MAESNGKLGCWGVVILLFIIGVISEKCKESEEEKVMAELKEVAEDLKKNYIGTYEGRAYDDTNIPMANIFPGYRAITFKVENFIPVLVREDDTFYKDLSASYNTNQSHVEGKCYVTQSDESGDRYSGEASIYYYPKDKKFCIAGSDGKSNLFGGDMCDIIVTPSYIEIYSGSMKGKLYKR